MANSETVYFNGELVAYAEAKISVEDRGFNFADGIYEVMRIAGGTGFRAHAHLDRLEASARALELDLPLGRDEFLDAMLQLARANGVEDGIVYLQLTRGTAPRRHAFPEWTRPTLVMLARPYSGPSEELRDRGVDCITVPDLRGGYCEVKTIALLPNVMAYQHARSEGCYEAILVRNGIVTEGTHTSAFCVRDGAVYTHPIDNILPGITRKFTIAALRLEDVEVIERAVTTDEFRSADELFLTGTTSEVIPVVRLDGEPIGDGRPGRMTRLAMGLYRRELEAARSGDRG